MGGVAALCPYSDSSAFPLRTGQIPSEPIYYQKKRVKDFLTDELQSKEIRLSGVCLEEKKLYFLMTSYGRSYKPGTMEENTEKKEAQTHSLITPH